MKTSKIRTAFAMAIAYLTRTLYACAGIVISASHNSFEDNGFKFFSAEGEKLPDEVEMAIEAELDRPFVTVESGQLGKAARVEDAAGTRGEGARDRQRAGRHEHQ